jgi:hypothetical protein
MRVSFLASLRELCLMTFCGTPLKRLDLSACTGAEAKRQFVELTELRLPREGFIGLAEVLLPGSRVEALYADIDQTELLRLAARLPEWGFDKLRIVSSRFESPFDWRAPPMQPAIFMTDRKAVTVRAAVAMTSWRDFCDRERFLLCALDLSALRLTEFPPGATLRRSPFLESVVLPPGL